MSWVSSSTTACATTLVASAARAAGVPGPAVVELSMSSSCRSMRREISAYAGKSSRSKSLNALNTGSLNVTVVSSQGCDHRRCTKQAVRAGGHAGRAVVDADELSHGSAFRVPAFLRGSSLCTGFPISQADHEQAIDGRVVVRRRRGHQGGMCAVRVGVGRDYQQNDPVAVESEDFDGVWRLESVSVESYRAAAGGELGGCFRPVAELIQHAVDAPEPHREHREQIGKRRSQVITVWPPCPIDIPAVGSLRFQPQPRRVLGRCRVSTYIGAVLSRPHGDTPVLAHEPPAVAGLGVTRHQSLSGTSDHAGRPSRSSSVLPKWLIIKGFRGCLGPSWANMALYQALYHFYSTSCARERRGTAAGRGKVDRGDSIPWDNGGGLAAVGPAICVSGGV